MWQNKILYFLNVFYKHIEPGTFFVNIRTRQMFFIKAKSNWSKLYISWNFSVSILLQTTELSVFSLNAVKSVCDKQKFHIFQTHWTLFAYQNTANFFFYKVKMKWWKLYLSWDLSFSILLVELRKTASTLSLFAKS